jgi:hypothetical protein
VRQKKERSGSKKWKEITVRPVIIGFVKRVLQMEHVEDFLQPPSWFL